MKIVLGPNQKTPKYQTPGSAGLDLCATHDIKIEQGRSFTMDLEIACEIPNGYYGKLVVRSSTGVKGLILCHGTGVIDSDYTGNIRAPLTTHNLGGYCIKKGERIVQLLICPVEQVNIEVVDSIKDTERGSGGFGSTGL